MKGTLRSGLVSAFVFPIAFECLATAVILLVSDIDALAQNVSGPFTQAQVTAGRADYFASCAACHGADLAGGGDAPPLTGGFFVGDWSKRTTHEFYVFISATMPDGLAGDLSPETYSNIVSFLLAPMAPRRFDAVQRWQ